MTFNSEEELDTFMRLESRKFVEETPEWKRFNNPANIDVLLSYFSNRGIKVFDRKMLKSAFVSLRELLEPNQAPASVPMPVAPAPVDEDLENLPRIPLWETQPIAYKREIQQVYRGIDSETGLPRDFTQTQVDAMSAEIFKRTFEVPTTHLGRFTFGRK